MNSTLCRRLLMTALCLAAAHSLTAASLPPLNLWPGTMPGDNAAKGPEKDLTKASDGLVAGKPVIRLGNVAQPTLQVFRPSADKDTGTAVVVCPGGGYYILAMDLEGTEICEWLNSIGVTGVLVKYRVPRPEGQSAPVGPLMDAQRALGLTRAHAAEWGLNPQRIGVLGFSAGGHLAARLSNNFRERAYPAADEADKASCRPDFTVLIYPAYLTDKDNGDVLRPEMTVTSETPPTFIAIAQDDPVRVENALHYSVALQAAKVPFELHVYPTGGHGYGLRRTKEPVTSWSDRATDWLRSRGLLEKK